MTTQAPSNLTKHSPVEIPILLDDTNNKGRYSGNVHPQQYSKDDLEQGTIAGVSKDLLGHINNDSTSCSSEEEKEQLSHVHTHSRKQTQEQEMLKQQNQYYFSPLLEKNKPDASLILGAERTLFAALNNSWLIAIGGIGLMSVGNNDDRATQGGIFILSLGMTTATIAYGMHLLRIHSMKTGKDLAYSHTILWATIIAALTVTTLSLELYFGILHPYLDREKAVTIANTDD